MAEQDVMGALRVLLECARRGDIGPVPADTWVIIDAINRGTGPEMTEELADMLEEIRSAIEAIDDERMLRGSYDLTYQRLVGPKTKALWRHAYGDEYPDSLETLGYTTWSLIARFVDELSLAAGETLLDLGCGRGGIGLEIARRTGARVVSSDFSRVGLASAQRVARALGVATPSAVVGDIASVPLRDASVDAVACIDVIEVAGSRLAVLREIARVLVPRGRLVLTAIDLDPGADVMRPHFDRVESTAAVARDAGLEVLADEEIANWRDGVRRLYTAVMERRDDLEAEMAGFDQTAEWMLEHLDDRRYVLVVARRPG